MRYLLVNALHWRSAEKENPFSDSFDLPQNTAGLDLKCIHLIQNCVQNLIRLIIWVIFCTDCHHIFIQVKARQSSLLENADATFLLHETQETPLPSS